MYVSTSEWLVFQLQKVAIIDASNEKNSWHTRN